MNNKSLSWNGWCPAGKHGLDYQAQPCDQCKKLEARAATTPRWTVKRVRAVINAVTAMLAGEEGEGDWDPDNSFDDLNAGLAVLRAEHERLMAKNSQAPKERKK